MRNAFLLNVPSLPFENTNSCGGGGHRGIRGSSNFNYLVFNGTAVRQAARLDTLNPPLYARYIIEAARPRNFSSVNLARSKREEILSKKEEGVTARGVRFCNPSSIKETYHQFFVQLYYKLVINSIIHSSWNIYMMIWLVAWLCYNAEIRRLLRG